MVQFIKSACVIASLATSASAFVTPTTQTTSPAFVPKNVQSTTALEAAPTMVVY